MIIIRTHGTTTLFRLFPSLTDLKRLSVRLELADSEQMMNIFFVHLEKELEKERKPRS